MREVTKITRASGWRSDRVRTFTAVMRVLAAHADADGRDVQITARTIAKKVGVEMRTVRRHLAAAREAGLVREIERGRHATPDEVVQIYEHTDRVVRHLPSVRALVHPRPQPPAEAPEPDVNVRPLCPPQGTVAGFQTVGLTKRGRGRTRQQPPARQRPRAAHRAAAELVAYWPWLAPPGRQHIGAVVDVLVRAGVGHWTGHTIAKTVDDWHADHGWLARGREARNPVGWLAATLARVLADQPEPPQQVRALPERFGSHQRITAGARRDHVAAPQVAERYANEIRRTVNAGTASRGHARWERSHETGCQIPADPPATQGPVSTPHAEYTEPHHSTVYATTSTFVDLGLEHRVPPNMS